MGTVQGRSAMSSRKTILLVEDDLDVRDLLQDFLEERGYDVIPAETGKQALDFLTMDPQSPPDVVILDLMMPIMTGWQVLERIRSEPRLAEIPVVVLTAVHRDKPTGATALFRKPFRVEALFETIRSFLEGAPPRPVEA
jgi:two-component system, OmpR family, response regulator CpxR